MKIDLNNYLDKVFECPECHWKGIGSELENGDFSELHFIFDFESIEKYYLIHWMISIVFYVTKLTKKTRIKRIFAKILQNSVFSGYEKPELFIYITRRIICFSL